MNRYSSFINLVFGWRDAESGYGAGRFISPDLKAFFSGWLGVMTPAYQDLQTAKQEFMKEEYKGARERLHCLADRLEELAKEIRDEYPKSTA
jgi:hypothetical protein